MCWYGPGTGEGHREAVHGRHVLIRPIIKVTIDRWCTPHVGENGLGLGVDTVSVW